MALNQTAIDVILWLIKGGADPIGDQTAPQKLNSRFQIRLACINLIIP
jgi:hypothetical protein